MILSHPQRGGSKVSTVSDDESVVVSHEPGNPPPYEPRPPVENSSPCGTALQPRCNYLLECRTKKGAWHVDTSLSIPESVLPPITEFDGHWNEDVRKLRKDETPSASEVRPNLMIVSEYGGIRADVHVLSNDAGRAVIVAESRHGVVHLDVNASSGCVLAVYAHAIIGEVKVWIPSWFEGALEIGTSFGEIKISEAVKAKLTVFSCNFHQSRGYIGDWNTSGFGAQSTDDPFVNGSRSIIKIGARNGFAHIGFLDEKPKLKEKPKSSPKQVKGFWSALFGRGVEARQGGDVNTMSQSGPSSVPTSEAQTFES